MGYTKSALKGVSWIGLFRVVSRGLSFVRTAILARLLTPAQFGVFGIATIILAFAEILTETGINIFLIQKKDKAHSYIDTAWVVSILRGIFIGIGIALFAGPIASFFHSPDVYPILLVTSIVPIIRGFINPSVINFVKDLEFQKEFYYRTSIFFVEAISSVLLVYINGTVYGLVWGLITGAIFEVLLSFGMAAVWPRLRFNPVHFAEVLSRGKWLTASGIFNYLYHNADTAAVGRILGTSSLGLYDMAYKISMLPITEISDVIEKVSLPLYMKILHDRKRFFDAYLKTVIGISVLVVPIGLVFFLFPEHIVRLILGEKWLGVTEVLRALALFGVVRAVVNSVTAPLYALEKQEYDTFLNIISLVGLLVTLFPFIAMWGLVGAAYSAMVGTLISVPFAIYFMYRLPVQK